MEVFRSSMVIVATEICADGFSRAVMQIGSDIVSGRFRIVDAVGRRECFVFAMDGYLKVTIAHAKESFCIV